VNVGDLGGELLEALSFAFGASAGGEAPQAHHGAARAAATAPGY
jgi:hypothetical protein